MGINEQNTQSAFFFHFANSGVSYSIVLTGVVCFGVTGGLEPKKDWTRRPFLSSGSYLGLTEHPPNLENRVKSINWHTFVWAYLESSLKSFLSSLRKLIEKGIPDSMESGTFD